MRATILIPAHNEASVIGRTLMHLTCATRAKEFCVTVIANACTDATASCARSVMPAAKVLETEVAGKCNALNLGYMLADKTKPIICLDADLEITAESLVALVLAMEDDQKKAACGHMDVSAAEASPVVRAYYKGWRTNPYFDRGKFGGVFAMAPEMAAQLFPLPLVTADDEYVRRHVGEDRIAYVPNSRFVARAPKSLSSLIEVRRRSLRGAREVSKMGLQSPERGSFVTVIGRMLRKPKCIISIGVYAGVNLWARLSLNSGSSNVGHWERDMTSRIGG
ncbi:glycosyltransferase [Pseudopelagicola sp. nBUS_19]|uniref:glycosyltransferase n=1 Tax=unclassified Pseudopelagicola TaxID=2649563 RepID=UPI003EB7AE0A